MEAEDRGSGGRGSGGGLIGGLPEELVLSHVLPRLPWYTRPVCRAISKSWRAMIDSCRKRPDIQLKSRKYQLPLLDGLVLICTFDNNIFITRDRVPVYFEDQKAEYFSVPWRSDAYQIHRQWRKLPPSQELFPPPPTWPTLIASSGMLYVWSNEKESNFVLKLDMGCGDWTWNKFPTPHHFNSNAVHFNGKIYVPRVSAGDSANPEKKMVVAYDMMTDQCEWVEAWNRDNLRVSRSSSHGKEELYSLVEHESVSDSKLEVLVYDTCKDSWKTREKIPIPECQWSDPLEVNLLNGDCFEPAAETGTNITWIDSESETISWINPSLHEDWVDINYNVFLEGRCLEYIEFIRGSVYGIFIEDKDGEDDEGEEKKDGEEGEEDRTGKQDPSLFKRTLMKGRINVANCIVMWEEVFEVGCMQEKYYLRPHVASPINNYTIMA